MNVSVRRVAVCVLGSYSTEYWSHSRLFTLMNVSLNTGTWYWVTSRLFKYLYLMANNGIPRISRNGPASMAEHSYQDTGLQWKNIATTTTHYHSTLVCLTATTKSFSENITPSSSIFWGIQISEVQYWIYQEWSGNTHYKDFIQCYSWIKTWVSSSKPLLVRSEH